MDNKSLAKEIIRLVGGKGNILQAWHCITRLRFNLADTSKADTEALSKLDGILKSQFQGDQFQIVIGNNVANVYTAIKEEIGDLENANPASGSGAPKGKVNPINLVFDTISGIFNPILPAIIGAGLLKGLLSLITFFGWLNPDGSEYAVFNMISDAAFYFLPFLIAFSASKKFKTNEFVAVSLAGILMYPAFANSTEASLKFFFLKIPVVNYSSSVLPIILGVLLLSFVYRFFDKKIPKAVRLIFAPLLSLLITAPITLFLLAPIGNYAGLYLANFFEWLFAVAGPIAGLLLAGFMPFIVMTGMHYALFPVALGSMDAIGYDILLLPMSLVNNIAQCAATLAVGVKTKDKALRSMAFSCALSAFFGITEPAMYGVTLKLKKPLYAAMIGSGIGGAIYGLFKVKSFAFSIPGITSIPSYLNTAYPQNFMWAIIGMLVSFVVAFILTIILGFEDINQAEKNDITVINTSKTSTGLVGSAAIISPVDGKTIPLSQVEDDVFSGEILGKGIGIIPLGNTVKAPFDGKVSMVTDTSHAIGILSDNGIELLIHIGINSVALGGKGFKTLVKNGETIKKGQNILTFDIDVMNQNNISTTSTVIVTNTDQFNRIDSYAGKNVVSGVDEILSVITV